MMQTQVKIFRCSHRTSKQRKKVRKMFWELVWALYDIREPPYRVRNEVTYVSFVLWPISCDMWSLSNLQFCWKLDTLTTNNLLSWSFSRNLILNIALKHLNFITAGYSNFDRKEKWIFCYKTFPLVQLFWVGAGNPGVMLRLRIPSFVLHHQDSSRPSGNLIPCTQTHIVYTN